MRVNPAGLTLEVVTLRLKSNPALTEETLTPSSNPALRGVNLKVVVGTTLSCSAKHFQINAGLLDGVKIGPPPEPGLRRVTPLALATRLLDNSQ